MNLYDPIGDAIVSLLGGAAFSDYVDSVSLGQTWQDGGSHKAKLALVKPLAANLQPDARLRLDDYAQVHYDFELIWQYSAQGDLTSATIGMQEALAEVFGDGGETLRAAMSTSDLSGGALRCELSPPFAENQPDPMYSAPDFPNNLTMRWTLTVRAWVDL
jgi:hypothetical protein